MNNTGVDLQVLSTVPVMFSYWAPSADAHVVSRFLNDNIAETVASNPERFLAFGTVPLQDPIRAAEELKRCKTELNLSGIQIGTHVDDRNIGDSFFDPFLKAAADMNMPLFIHPWDMRDQGRHSKYWLPWLVGMPAETTQAALSLMFSGTFERFPNLRVCLAHGAGKKFDFFLFISYLIILTIVIISIEVHYLTLCPGQNMHLKYFPKQCK